MFKKKSRDKQEEIAEAPQPSSPPPSHQYGGQPEIDGGLDSSSKGGGIIDKFSTGRRRLKENLAQMTGKEGVDNAEFEERCQRVLELREKVTRVRDSMKRQLDCSRALCLACADLGNASADADIRDPQFQNTQFQLDEDLRKRLDEAIVRALESLENKLHPFVEVEKMIVSRNRLKLDYDHYVRKVRDLKDRPGSDAVKLSSNEAKLTAARQRLHEATSRLYKGFGYYDAVGGTICKPEIEMFKKAQQDFFGAASAAINQMQARDPKDVAAEVEAVGKDGMNAPFTLPGEELGSHAGGGGLSGMSGAFNDPARDDSPDRTPSSAYVPSTSAPWMTGGAGAGTSGSGAHKAGSGASGVGGGGSWWDKHASTSDKQPAGPSGWGEPAPSQGPPAAGQQRARALFSYSAVDNTELSLVEGEVLTVVAQDQSGWWTGEKRGRKGLFPSNYVELV